VTLTRNSREVFQQKSRIFPKFFLEINEGCELIKKNLFPNIRTFVLSEKDSIRYLYGRRVKMPLWPLCKMAQKSKVLEFFRNHIRNVPHVEIHMPK
jgi:hypothetical protein